jgi:predicted kinase
MSTFLLQMAGPPGIGKSTVASRLCVATGAVRLDVDVVKSSLLGSRVPWDIAGPATYSLVFALAADILATGRSVVVDSPSHYREVVDSGSAAAAQAGAAYAFVELKTDDLDLLHERLAARRSMPSQMTDLNTWPAGGSSSARKTGTHSWENAKPVDVPVLTLTVDRRVSPDELVDACLRYLSDRTGPAR